MSKTNAQKLFQNNLLRCTYKPGSESAPVTNEVKTILENFKTNNFKRTKAKFTDE
jgi:hypothetical protein